MRGLAALVLAMLLASLLAACAQLPERVILLPDAEGRASALQLQPLEGAQSPLLLNQAYAQADLVRGELRSGLSSAEAVQQAYGPLLAMQPQRPRTFIVHFRTNADGLTPETAPVLAQVRAALAAQAAGELIVTGHTDRVGSPEANDRLSLARAQTVRELLAAMGVARELISVAGRGEREPLVPTADEAAEARNRRVEIKLR
ncbi:OmpA family protein [Roseateles toxinivorans]|uniref:Outer membrane protein OmpA-like peptidoglycan-associated protein n=1 Tax=Roseateles toxinivorans TaxID=270368 RepID=A0A4R6QRG9_9BURK|nr:OmpA family protein [Roseateles toxinivorans]TDP72361.1 outer membrane protein OmpA-like peptidoglycan-associated protein [Roseateles toxinivorans]